MVRLCKVLLVYHTIRHLKYKQIFFRVWYFLRNRISPPIYKPLKLKDNAGSVSSPLVLSPKKSCLYLGDNCFKFLNIKHCFDDEIDWNFEKYGKLWTYNLNYFEFVNQYNLNERKCRALVKNFTKSLKSDYIGLEAYPISLRGINLIKFFIENKISDILLLESLYGQYNLLRKKIEFHLLGNHLLENGLSLLAGGVYFNDEKLVEKAKIILKNEFDEQILKDGAHFERSPMYHKLILERILDVVNIINSCSYYSGINEIFELLCHKAGLMLGWLEKITFVVGAVPNFNDSTEGIALNTRELVFYASELKIKPITVDLSESGLRRFIKSKYDCIIDAGDIGPDYQPGHAHSDTFSFVLYINNIPVIVDTGVSTYEKSKRRLEERRTSAHNTFKLKDIEQTEVWSSFRVGRRAYCTIHDETDNSLYASHSGYKFKGLDAKRYFLFKKNELVIKDNLNNVDAEGYLHFHPDININISGSKIESTFFDVLLENHETIKTSSYEFAEGFNKTKEAPMVSVGFKGSMVYRIIIKND